MAAILLIHGYSGGPRDLKELGEHLEQQLGGPVVTPALPGHASQPEDLIGVTPADWLATIAAQYQALRRAHDRVAVLGLSFGANLMFSYISQLPAEERPNALVALGAPARFVYQPLIEALVAAVKPFAPILTKPEKGFLANEEIPGYTQIAYRRMPLGSFQGMLRFVRTQMTPLVLGKVTSPTLLIQGTNDPIIISTSPHFFAQHLGSMDKKIVIWQEPYHLIVQGQRKDELAVLIAKWLQKWLG